MTTSFDDNYKNTSIAFNFSVSYANKGNCYSNPTGFQNLNNKEKSKGIVVVVVCLDEKIVLRDIS